jgi:hypothetical protein
MALTGYYSAQDFIIERIKDQVSSVAVFADYQLAGVLENAQITPAIHVLIDGEEHSDSSYGGDHTVRQRWLIITVVRNVTDQRGLSARQQADPILLGLALALNGWQPSEDHGPMVSISSPPPSFTQGFGYYPLAYTSEISIPGSV